MALTPDRQGYLGNLESKTLPQLQELLERQEQIISDRNLFKSLPDKGEKVQRFAEKLRQIIQQRLPERQVSQKASASSSNFTKPSPLETPGLNAVSASNPNIDQTLEALLSRNEENAIITQHGDNNDKHEKVSYPADDVKQLSSHLQEFHIGSKSQDVPVFSNSYENVIKKATTSTDTSKTKYLPNRTLKYPIEESPSLQHDQTDSKKEKPVEESAVHPPLYTHQSIKLISIEESVSLIKEQRKRNENLVAKRAALRLAERLGPKMETYLPSELDMQYRETKTVKAQEYDSDDVLSDQDDVLDDVD